MVLYLSLHVFTLLIFPEKNTFFLLNTSECALLPQKCRLCDGMFKLRRPPVSSLAFVLLFSWGQVIMFLLLHLQNADADAILCKEWQNTMREDSVSV